MIGPNRAAAFNRGSQRECILDTRTDKLFELNTTALILSKPEQRDERQIHCGSAWGKTSQLGIIVSFRSPAGWSMECVRLRRTHKTTCDDACRLHRARRTEHRSKST